MKLFLAMLVLTAILFSGESETLSTQQKMKKTMAEARTIKKMQGSENEIAEKTLKTIPPVKVDTTKPKKRVVFNQKKNTKNTVKQNKGKQVCKSSKKSLRELEIAEGLSFYRNSSFYSFTK